MSDFLERLRECVKGVEQDWSFYDIKNSVMLLLEDGQVGVLDKIDSQGIIINKSDSERADCLDEMIEAISPDASFTDEEIIFFFNALNKSLTQPHAITAAISDKFLSVSIIEHGQATQCMMIRSSQKTFERVIKSDDCGSSKLASAINDFYKASKGSGDVKSRQLAEGFKEFERQVKRARERRLEEYPELSGDFWNDVGLIYEYCENFDEFNELVSKTSVHSMNDRHLSRLSRATLAFDSEDERAGGTIYGRVPIDVNEIGAGDWVTFSESYAEGHMRSMREYGEEYHVISMNTEEGEVVMITDENEFAYIPDGLWGDDVTCLGDVWKGLNEDDKPFSYEPIEEMYEQKLKGSTPKLKM